MDKSLNLFDLSFFVPAAVLAGGLWMLELWTLPTIAEPGALLVAGLILVSIANLYAVGMLIHGINRQYGPGYRSGMTGNTAPWFQHLRREQCEELAVYFWYTRATCHNNATVSAILFLACFFRIGQTWFCGVPPLALAYWGCVLCPAAWHVFYQLGNEYHRAMHAAATACTAQSGPLAKPEND